MSAPNWWGDWRPILTPHTGNLQPTDLLECTSIVGGLPVNTAITGAQIIAAASGGGATWGSITGTLSAQTDLQGALDNKVPYTGATADVNLGSHDLTATQGTFATGGSSDTLTVNHTSGSGKAITITKGGAGEGIYVNKTSGSGNAVTIIGDLEATTIKKSSGTSTQFLKADGSVDTTTYQPTLVSGTNIKTVNGNSLLGSGNLTITGGGGLQGIHNMLGFYPSGYSLSAAITSVAPAFLQPNANLIYLNPLIPNKSITYNTIRFNVSTLVAGVNARILIYSDLNGLPNTKLYESADLSCATTGIKSVSVTGTFNAGTIYWIGFYASGQPTFTSINQTACIPIAHNTMTTAPVTAWTYTYTYGSAPATLNQSFRGVFNASLLLLQFLP
jgi:hypothetical protein